MGCKAPLTAKGTKKSSRVYSCCFFLCLFGKGLYVCDSCPAFPLPNCYLSCIGIRPVTKSPQNITGRNRIPSPVAKTPQNVTGRTLQE